MGGIRWEGLEKGKKKWEREWGRWRCEGEGEGRGRPGGVWQRAEEALSDADRDTFAPELWNCVVWNWNGGASGAVICNKFQVLQHFEGAPPATAIPTFLLPRIYQKPPYVLPPLSLFSPLCLSYISVFLYRFCPLLPRLSPFFNCLCAAGIP